MSKRKQAASAAKRAKDRLKPNKPVRTPNHPTKSHMVLAKEGGKEKLIRFGQQGVRALGKTRRQKKRKHVSVHIMHDITLKIKTLAKCQHVIGPIR